MTDTEKKTLSGKFIKATTDTALTDLGPKDGPNTFMIITPPDEKNVILSAQSNEERRQWEQHAQTGSTATVEAVYSGDGRHAFGNSETLTFDQNQ